MKKPLCLLLCLLLLLPAAGGCAGPSGEEAVQTLSIRQEQISSFDRALADALAQAGARLTRILLPDDVCPLTEDAAVPANVSLVFGRGTALSVAAGRTLTIFGGVEAPNTYIFPGEGTVAGNIRGDAYVQWFGADASDFTANQTVPFQKALDVCDTVLVPSRAREYRVSSLTITRPVTLRGTGAARTAIRAASAAEPLIDVCASQVRIENLAVSFTPLEAQKRTFVRLNTEQQDLQDVSLYNIFVTNPGFAVCDAGAGQHTASNVTLDHIKINSNYNTGVWLRDCSTGIKLLDVTVSSFGPNLSTKGYVFENVQQMYLENVDNLGGFTKTVKGGDGLTFINCANVSCYRVMTDYLNARHLVIRNCTKFHFSNFVTSLMCEEGLYFDGLTDSVMDVIKVNGNYPSTGPGAYLKNCTGNVFNDLIIIDASQSAVVLENCSGNVFNNLVTAGAARPYALEEREGCRDNRFQGLILTGAFSLQGDGSSIHGLRDEKDRLFAVIAAPAEG